MGATIPNSVLGQVPPPGATRRGIEGYKPEDARNRSIPPSMPRTRALPSPSLAAEDAASIELRFLAGFERALDRLEALPDPSGAAPLARARAVVDRVEYDRSIERERDALRFGKPLRGPAGAFHVERWRPRRWFGAAASVAVAAAVVHPDRDFRSAGASSRPLGPEAAEPAVCAALAGGCRFAWVGVLSSTGWTPEALARPPAGPDHAVLLVRFDAPTGRSDPVRIRAYG